ncbi:MAG: hypothetical protein EOO59_13505 [Hymenobacter sp.]|nr:MAG: hypothetical protein EOO59_13505 [Hymenobacter sp.]
MAKSPRKRKLSGYARQQQVALGLLLFLGGFFGLVSLAGGIQMLLNSQDSAGFSTARAGLPPGYPTSYGPATPIVLGGVLLVLCLVAVLARRKAK